MTRRLILQKARHHPLTGSDFLWACGFRFSFTPLPGYFSPFPHGTRSLSVRQEYSGLPNGLGGFARGSTGPVLLGRRDRQTMRVQVRGPHPLRPGIQPGSPDTWFSATAGRPVGAGARDPATPRAQPPTGITRARFGHHPLSLATTHGISFPAGTEMFHFPAYPPAEAGTDP